jgi:hypothetical protein
MEQQRTLLEDFIENAVSVIEEAEFRGDLDLVELLAGFVLAAHRILNASRGDLLRRLEVSEGE